MSKVPEPTSIPQFHTHLMKRGHHVAPPKLRCKRPPRMSSGGLLSDQVPAGGGAAMDWAVAAFPLGSRMDRGHESWGLELPIRPSDQSEYSMVRWKGSEGMWF